jgi:hypothetical protein
MLKFSLADFCFLESIAGSPSFSDFLPIEFKVNFSKVIVFPESRNNPCQTVFQVLLEPGITDALYLGCSMICLAINIYHHLVH